MRPRRFSCNWERKKGAMMMMSREVHSFIGVCFSVLFLFSCGVTAPASVHRLQTAAGHNSFNTHLDIAFSVCSWQMKNTADCLSDHYCYSSVYDLYFLLSSAGLQIRPTGFWGLFLLPFLSHFNVFIAQSSCNTPDQISGLVKLVFPF